MVVLVFFSVVVGFSGLFFFGILSFRACSSSFVGEGRGREPVRAPSFVCRGFLSCSNLRGGFCLCALVLVVSWLRPCSWPP